MVRFPRMTQTRQSRAATAVVAAAGALGGLASASHAVVFVRPVLWFNPSGATTAPFSNFAGATCRAVPFETITVRQGTFPDTFTCSKPLTLTTTGGEIATIGAQPTSVTSLKIFTFNLHLFGDVVPFLPIWQDGARTGAIAGLTASNLGQGVDLVGYQELWDPDYWDTIRVLGAYPHGGYGGRRDSGSAQNSGLALFSLWPISGGTQISYNDENGIDASASKGFLRQTIVKDGITIGVWVTHTQSGDGDSDKTTRLAQMQQLGIDIQVFRALYPSSPVFVMGDFNVEGETSEFTGNMSNAMGGLANVADTAINLGSCNGDGIACTSCSDNDLREYFNGVKPGTRLDYVLYANASNGSVRVIPKVYDVRRPLAGSTISGSGYAPENGGIKSMSSRMLSDHDAVYAEFELRTY